jgi:hypothetical protein
MAEITPDPAVEPAPTPVAPAAGADDTSKYVVVADETAVPTTSKAARPSGKAVKPDTLPDDSYVVVTEPAASEPASSGPASSEPASSGLDEPAPTQVVEPAPTEIIAPPAPAAEPQIVYVTAPVPPKRAGNRGFATLITLVATILFAVLYAFAVLIIVRIVSATNSAALTDLANPGYWLPVLFFAVAMLLVVLVINRGGWWAHIFGSAIVALAVYLGAGAVIALIEYYIYAVPVTYLDVLGSPTIIVAGVIARELALWSGALISRRGRKVTARNHEARAAFDREQSETAAAR